MTKTVLVTGASGFLASYVIDEYLKAGWKVKGTVRDARGSKAQHVIDRFPKGSKLELAEVKDLITGEGLEEALKGVDAIAHTASPYALTVTDARKDFIDPAVEGTLTVLRAAKKAGIKRIVVTSSFAAVTNFALGGPFRDYTYTGDDWNPVTLEEALEPGRPGAFVYSASKKLAEEAAFEYGKKEGLEIVTMNPPMIYGPPLQEIKSKSDINTSSAAIYQLVNGPADRPVPDNRLPLFAYVRDVALAHVRALDVPEAKGRYILCGGGFTWQTAVKYVAEQRPELASRLPKLTSEENRKIAILDTTPAQKVLGIEKFQDWQTTLLETLDALIAKEKDWES